MPFSYLTAVELFQGISESESQRVARMCTERRYRKGTTIFSKGDPANSLYIVKDGRVRILRSSVAPSPGSQQPVSVGNRREKTSA